MPTIRWGNHEYDQMTEFTGEEYLLADDGSETLAVKVEDISVFSSYAIICDEKSSGTEGGTFNSGADRTRDLNTKIADPDGIVSISSNRFTLGAGTYFIAWSAPAQRVDQHRSLLYNYTDGTVVRRGENARASRNYYAMTRSDGYVRVAIASAKEFEIRHRCVMSKDYDGFGEKCGFSDSEIYTSVKIFKETCLC